jgi:hypothetical protein
VSGVYFLRVTVYHTSIEIEVLYPWSRFGFFMVGKDVLGDVCSSLILKTMRHFAAQESGCLDPSLTYEPRCARGTMHEAVLVV